MNSSFIQINHCLGRNKLTKVCHYQNQDVLFFQSADKELLLSKVEFQDTTVSLSRAEFISFSRAFHHHSYAKVKE
jgi:hypothetical protein